MKPGFRKLKALRKIVSSPKSDKNAVEEKKSSMIDAGLVLEGGGMKGVYTAGVLDYFIDKGIMFKNQYGVSAGACCMTGYIAGQKGHTRDVFTDYIGMKQYMGVYSFLTTGDVFGADMSFNLVPNYINPFDYDTYRKFEGNAYAVVTNIVSGEPEYIKITDAEEQVDYIRASSSLPLVSKNVKIDGKVYLDGGISDSIPIHQSIKDGNVKNVVVLTKHEGYRRHPEDKRMLAALKVKYARFPKVHELMKNRCDDYNAVLDFLEKEKEAGNVFIIRPKEDANISRMEKDKDKLLALYETGYKDAEASFEKMMEYLNK